MKHLIFLLSLFSATVLACADDRLKDYSAPDKFLIAAEEADIVYFGKVVRLYMLPDTPENSNTYNGFVFQVKEILKGTTGNFMEVEKLPWCGVNQAEMENYWPEEFGQEYVAAIKRIGDVDYLIAVYPLKEAKLEIYKVDESDSLLIPEQTAESN